MKKMKISIALLALMVLGATGCTYYDESISEMNTQYLLGFVIDETIEENQARMKMLEENSRKNPAGINEVFKLEAPLYENQAFFELEMVDLISGEEALQIIKDADKNNKMPEEDEEYIFAKFRAKVLQTENDEFLTIYSHDFNAVSEDGVTYIKQTYLENIQSEIRGDLYEGSEIFGFVYFLVKKDDNPVVVYERGQRNEVWFDLRAEKE
jgi:hypothetical protein